VRSQTATPNVPGETKPLHLRLQGQAPFVRPLTGQHERLGHVYNAISESRSRLKVLNIEISDCQQDGFNDVAEGANVKGWMVVGKGVRFIPGIQMIEGRSKEDVRWHEIQDERGAFGKILYVLVVIMTGVFLGASCEFFFPIAE